MTWLRQHWLWLAPLAVVVACSLLLSTYRSVYSGQVGQLEESVREQRAESERQRAYAAALESAVSELEAGLQGIDALYEDVFSSESARFTALLREIKDLAQRSGLEPRNIQYPEQLLTDHGLIRRRVNFSVEGSYLDLRRFINLVELSDMYIVLERITVSDSQRPGDLQLGITLSTLFAGRDTVRLESGAS